MVHIELVGSALNLHLLLVMGLGRDCSLERLVLSEVPGALHVVDLHVLLVIRRELVSEGLVARFGRECRDLVSRRVRAQFVPRVEVAEHI